MTPGASHITGTITRAWTNHDGVTHLRVKTRAGEVCGVLQACGIAAEKLAGRNVHHAGDLWVLTNPKAAQP